jgi:pyrroline-5-carboxylate reductase
MQSMQGTTIGIIGAGAIGGAVIDRLLNGAGARPQDIVACEAKDPRREEIGRRFGVRTTSEAVDAVGGQLVVLAVPPLEMSKILGAIHDRVGHRPVIVSFAAAFPLALLESSLPSSTPVVRVNPNSPSLVGAGFNPVAFGVHATGAARGLADRFLAALGNAVEVDDETMNQYTALTAVGPTYFLPVFDAMIAAGVSAGLTREATVAAVAATARGTAEMVAQRAEAPDQLKLYTGLRPLKDAEVRDLVAQAVGDALSRMTALQQKIAEAARNP